MSQWRFLAYDLRTESFLTELPVERWTSMDVSNGSGRWSASIPVNPTRTHTVTGAADVTVTDTSLVDSTRRGRVGIVAYRDGVPVYTGLIHARAYNSGNRMVNVSGGGLFSYFDLFAQRLAPTYNNVDQFTIFEDFVDQVQSNTTGGDIGVNVAAATSGVTRNRHNYVPYSGNTWGQLMRNLAAVRNGFDFDFRTEVNAGQVERWCRLWYPRRGDTFDATNLTFRLPASGSGGNVYSYEMRESQEQMAVEVTGLGAGDGEDMLIASFAVTDLVDAGWPGYTTVRSWKDVRELDTLTEHAQAAATRLSGVDSEVYRLDVDPNFRMRPYGSWEIGDDCQLVIENEAFHPAAQDGSPGLVAPRRVLAHTWTINAGREQLQVDVGQRWKAVA